MHLESLELFGFKSFADKTIFNFHEGVTAVVGPNGCGKSNLLDAIRWVLGEQSAKSLRGGEMADVIFNGTDTRKPLGFAEVSLAFSDCETELNVDWHDVRVTRRVYRDGNSEYFLNKTACRLRDIQSLFADTGVTRSAYSMMEQGRIDMILSSRPEDRRAVFEEAAGITKYKTQKREALRKLEATDANLLRIGDVIKEVKRQIGSLQRQAGKARRYQALHADLRILETHYSKKQLEAFESELKQCRSEIETTADEERITHEKINSGENKLADERHALDRIDVEIADLRAKAQRLQSEIATHRGRIEFNRQRAEEFNELIERARSEISTAEAKRNQHASDIAKADALIERTNQALQSKEKELNHLSNLLSELRAKREAREADREAGQISLSKHEERIASLEDELSGITARRELTQEQIRQIAAEIKRATEVREKIVTEISEARVATEGEHKKVEELLAQSEAAEKDVHRHQELLASAEHDIMETERLLAEKRSTLTVLRQLNAEGEGLAQGSQAVLKGMDDPARFRSTVAGSLVAQFDVDPKFIAAIEAALGRSLHAVILNNPDHAEEIIARLTKKKLGQAALFVSKFGTTTHESVRKSLPEGAIAWAIDKVVAPRSLEPLLRQLLSRVVVFAKLDQALACKKEEPTLAMATLDGEFVSAEGIVFGGSSTVKGDSLLERKARIAALIDEEADYLKRRDLLLQKRDEQKAKVQSALTRMNDGRASYQSVQLEQSKQANRISLFEREVADSERKIDNLRSEQTTLQRQMSVADDRVAELETELEAIREKLSEEEAEQASAEQDEEEVRSEEASVVDKLNELKLEIATERQRRENLLGQREPMAARDAELLDLIDTRRRDIANYEKRIETQSVESREDEAAIVKQTNLAAEAESAANRIVEQRTAQVANVQKLEPELRTLRDSLSEMQERRGRQQVRESQLQMQIGNLAENISRRYQVDLRAFTPDDAGFEKTLQVQLKRTEKETVLNARVAPGDTELNQLIADLTRQLDNMGPVNLDAVQEYDELEERYKFLESQNTDLSNSRRELLDVIAHINSTTKKLFAETFAQVRTNFREMFAELFGGGRADLSLVDESDPLNCGIEISAKPPGKQLQSISLLSGGERAMTAVSLLFAIYMVRPSPFCILDEIDAPLDESNINRFIRVLDRFVAQSQFIIITHNKRTIAKASILYGVTMEERGVSKLVGMKLTAPPAAEQTAPPPGTVSLQREFSVTENGHTERKASRAGR
jgi:chromosome segregation protein